MVKKKTRRRLLQNLRFFNGPINRSRVGQNCLAGQLLAEFSGFFSVAVIAEIDDGNSVVWTVERKKKYN